MDTNYKLVQSVDPTKNRPKIKDKFAKLTLSSNKKKQEDAAKQQQIREQATQSNVSRNLISELLTDAESTEKQNPAENLLMRTDSSPSGENVVHERPRLDTTGTTHCSELEQDFEKSIEMEQLLVSEMENTEAHPDVQGVIEMLSARVSLLTVGTDRVTISSGLSDIVSMEKQKMDSEQIISALRPENRKTPEDSINISSTSSEESEAPITISDSSEGEDEYEVNVSTSVTSDHQTTETAKADRMAAFLRDVRLNYGLPVDSPDRSDLERRQKEIATADTEPMTIENDSRSADTGTAARICSADTESMTLEDKTSVKEAKNTSDRRLAFDDTEDMTKASETMQSSPLYAPVMKVGTELLDDSLHKSSTSVPDDSLTIAETSEEEEEKSKDEQELPQAETQGTLKRSDSLSHRISTESSASSEQYQINISAKINIKIQVSQQLEESTSSDSTAHSLANDKSEDVSTTDDNPQSSAHKAQNPPNAIEDVPHSPPERDNSPKSLEVLNKSPDDFVENAHRILNELYGNNWKTPEVMRSLKKTTIRKRAPKPASELTESRIEPTNESGLDDFSIFRRNIPQDLDSTRLPTTPVSVFKAPKAVATEPKATFRAPKLSGKETTMKTPQMETTRTKSGRAVRQRWRALVDSDTESEGENASDADKSWSKSDEEDFAKKKSASPVRAKRGKQKANLSRSKNDDELVYLDLSKGEVEVQHNVSASPPANHDEKFNRRLEEILKTCRMVDKPKVECTSGGRTKRKLFTAKLNEDDEENLVAPIDSPKDRQRIVANDQESVTFYGAPLPAMFEPFNKHLESVKTGQPIFKIQTPKTKRDCAQSSTESPTIPKTPKSVTKELRLIGDLSSTPSDKYGFLKSLDLCVGKSLCHPDALYYRDNYRLKKDELANKLYEIYNKKCFNQQLNVPIKWNKKLTNTAGRCMNKKRMGDRNCVIELSEKVLTSADRLRCTLLHELCHAATWIFNGEGGHNATWKGWARKANQVFPELPKIGVCHQYDIEYKYTYKCTLCGAKSHAHSKSKKVENIRCSYCHGAIEVYLNKKDKEGNTVQTPVREATGFAKFVKDKYKEYKRPDLKHADVMKILSNEFASMKVDGKT